MAMLLDELGNHDAPAADRNVMVVWRGDTVALCLGRHADEVTLDVVEELRAALVIAGVDPAMIVLSAA